MFLDNLNVLEFCVKPKDLRALTSCGIDNMQDVIKIFCWAFVDWHKLSHVNLVLIYTQGVGNKLTEVSTTVFNTTDSTEEQLKASEELEEAITRSILELFKGIQVEYRLSLTVSVSKPTERQQMIAVGSYLPIFKDLLAK